jgi:hypothetical protein
MMTTCLVRVGQLRSFLRFKQLFLCCDELIFYLFSGFDVVLGEWGKPIVPSISATSPGTSEGYAQALVSNQAQQCVSVCTKYHR